MRGLPLVGTTGIEGVPHDARGGVIPNVGWLDGSGLDTSNGVLADAACVAAPGVVVAGDIARWHHQRYDEVMESASLRPVEAAR